MSALQQSEEFQGLDLKIQTIITRLAQSPQSFDELRTLIQLENQAIKAHVTSKFQKQQIDMDHDHYRQRFLGSLWYPDIYRRQETVGEAHQRTFQWIYGSHDSDTSAPRWDNFVQWLEKDGDIYWINGKAGSGKSTLMNYVCQDDRTAKLLKIWSGAKKVLAPRFFFWSAGSSLEKSFEGLLRSLLYQILQKFPSLTPQSHEGQYALGATSDGLRELEPIATWTKRRLRTAFQDVIRQAQAVVRICIFIDGLDEICEDPDTTIGMIKNVQSADVKVCLSSRPDRSYTEAFGSCATLRLQDLTEPDIRTYVFDKLQPFLRKELAHDVSEILNSIVLKAQGVFLWVELVVQTLIIGLQNDDSLRQLQGRVESTPHGIEALYAKMLSNIDVAYHNDAALLFKMALADLTRSLLEVALALYNGFDRLSEISIRDALQFSELTQKRIPTVSAGLLEVHLEDEDSKERERVKFSYPNHYLTLPDRRTCFSEAAKMSSYERYAHISFIHRTALEFLRHNEQGQRFLKANIHFCPSPHSTYVRALLAKVVLLRFPEELAPIVTKLKKNAGSSAEFHVIARRDCSVESVARTFVHEIMQNVALMERETGIADVSLCDDIDHTLATVYQRHYVASPTSHWSTRWGVGLCRSIERDWGLSWAKMSSRSSSPDSFHSARSEPTLIFDRPVDFLGHAASSGLSCYVSKIIDLQHKDLDKSCASYLLCCSVRALTWGERWPMSRTRHSQKLNLVAELLSRGGNPNIYINDFSTTVWGFLLMQILCHVEYNPSAFAMLARKFLENGADVHLIISRDHIIHDGLRLIFRCELSPLYIIRGRLEKSLELQALEEIVLAKGGHGSCKYTHVVHVPFDSDSSRSYKIPDRCHDKVLAVMNTSHYGNHLDSARRLGRVERSKLLGEIYQEIFEKSGDSDNRTSSEETTASETDAQERFHESVDTQTATDKEDDQALDG